MWNGVLRVLARITMVTNAGLVLVTLRGARADRRSGRNLVAAGFAAVVCMVLLFVSSSPSESFDIKVQRLRAIHINGRLQAMAFADTDGDGDDDDDGANTTALLNGGGGGLVHGGRATRGGRTSLLAGGMADPATTEDAPKKQRRRSNTGSAFHHYSV